MPNHNHLISKLWLTFSMVLLVVWVLVAPIRNTGLVDLSPRADCLQPLFALTSGQPTTDFSINASVIADTVLQWNDLSSEVEEQDWADVVDEPRVTFLIPCSIRKVSDFQWFAPRSTLSLYPLRC